VLRSEYSKSSPCVASQRCNVTCANPAADACISRGREDRFGVCVETRKKPTRSLGGHGKQLVRVHEVRRGCQIAAWPELHLAKHQPSVKQYLSLKLANYQPVTGS